MPKSIRDRMKGSIATAWVDCERALVQIAEVETAFSTTHDDLAEGLRIAGLLLVQTQRTLEVFYKSAWGSVPDDWVQARERK